MRGALAAALLAPGVALALGGCSAWHATRLAAPAPPAASDSGVTSASHAPTELGAVRVSRADGTTLELRHARIEGDSLVGDVRRDAWFGAGPRRVAIARADARRIDSRGFSTGRTVALLAFIVTASGLLIRASVGAVLGSD